LNVFGTIIARQKEVEGKEVQSDGMEICKFDQSNKMHDNLTAIMTDGQGIVLYCILKRSESHLQEKPMGFENAKNPLWK
jgi:hypothetical protein